MARRLRIEYSEAIYHVIQRGNNKEYIFDESEDKAYLIDCLQRAVEVDTGLSLEEFEQVKNSSRKRQLKKFKAAYALEASKEGYSMREIGVHIGLTDIAVNKYFR